MNWIYSKKLALYISLDPLKADTNTLSIANKHNIELEWDDYGNIMCIDFDDAKKLVSYLNGTILSPSEYWTLYNELLEDKNYLALEKLVSPKFTEILDRVYLRDGSYIDHPIVINKYEYDGEKIYEEIVTGRPGWIKVSDINIETGHPFKVRKKSKNHYLMKYWSPDLSVTKLSACFALRGYVTSTACVSLDLGIPADSKQPKQMIRLCLKEKPESLLSENELRKIEEEKCFNEGLNLVNKGFFGKHKITYNDFKEYIDNLKDFLNDGVENKKQLFFVMGHKNPDSDTVVTSIMESFRLHLINNNKNFVYLPFVQSSELPNEIKLIFGKSIYENFIYENTIDLKKLLNTGLVKIIYTDQNYQKEYQKYVVSVTDHHSKSKELESGDIIIPFNIQLIGSCSALIAIKFIGSNFDFDEKMADIFYSGMLMDTENRVVHKMTMIDSVVMDLIKTRSSIKDDNNHYINLMNKLIKEKDPVNLYYRDYKRYFGYGFAVLKVTDYIDEINFENNIKKIINIAKNDNKENNYYLSIIKVVEYNKDNLTVNRERIYYVFDDKTSGIVREKCIELLSKIVKVSFKNADIIINDNYMEITKAFKQISRKKIAPAIEAVLRKTGEFVYYNSIDKWVSRNFLVMNDYIKKYEYKLDIDKSNRICNISYRKSKELCNYLNVSMLSLSDYWKVYFESKEKKEYQMLNSLTDSTFIEFLDTTSNEISDYLVASPGLIDPNDIDLNTGLPKEIKSPNEYYNKSLWRYWSPPQDGHTYVFSRSFIFLLGQPCLDAKVYLDEGFANLGIRPVKEKNLEFEVEIEIKNRELFIYYKSEYENKKIIYNDSNFLE